LLKKISFKELIDLKPKPNKVMYNNNYFTWQDGEEYRNTTWDSLDSYIVMSNMNNKDIEIVGEHKLNGFHTEKFTEWQPQQLAIKINEIIDYIKEKEGK
jgi:spore maturation protein CgeB